MEFGIAHSSRLQYNNTCNLINPPDAGRGGEWQALRPRLLSTASGGRLSDGAGMAQAREELISAGNVGGDLRAQLFRTAEFFLGAKAFPKPHFHPLGCSHGLAIEQMRLNAERRAIECRARANVGDGAVTARLAFDASARDVDAASGEQLLFRDEVQGREGEAAARSRAADHFTC